MYSALLNFLFLLDAKFFLCFNRVEFLISTGGSEFRKKIFRAKKKLNQDLILHCLSIFSLTIFQDINLRKKQFPTIRFFDKTNKKKV